MVQVFDQYIAAAGQKDEDIAQPLHVETEHGFAVHIVVVKIDPAVDVQLPVPENMVTPDIAVFLAMIMEIFYGDDHFNKGPIELYSGFRLKHAIVAQALSCS